MTSPPKHIAIIMDGNGRWAESKNLSRNAGHKAGVEAARTIVEACAKRNIEVLSLFAFSSENWNRPKSEVGLLMELFLISLKREIKKLHKNRVRVVFIGNRSEFSDKLQKEIEKAETLTRDNTGMVLAIAANYGGRWDILHAVQQIAVKVKQGELEPEAIDYDILSAHLSLSDLPDPDLFIRTSGEQRISNYFLWQLAYTECFFTETLWPDFDDVELDKALEAYASRQRRFGKTSKQLENKNA
jgi:undecaprenyl diphosphate synthase